jgi:hypothetical protein
VLDPADAWAVTQYRPSHAVREHGAIAIPTAHWEEWRHRFRNLPAPDALPASRRSDLKAAWGLERKLLTRWDGNADPVRLLRDRLVAAEGESTHEATIHLRTLLDWFAADEELAPAADLVRADEHGARVETVYFDVPDTFDRPQLHEWRAFGLKHGRLSPAFGERWVLVPEPVAA